MTVHLNEAAISAFFRNPEGPVARNIETRAQRVAQLAQQNARVIMQRYAGDAGSFIGYRLEQGAEGIQAVVGIQDQGKIASYLSEKEERERVWLVPALRDGLDG